MLWHMDERQVELNRFAEGWFERNMDRILDDWSKLLQFRSISADPDLAADCQACAVWLAGYLERLDLSARLLPTGGPPAVYAASKHERHSAEDRRVLLYGHYDVQPVDPLDAWESPPFSPVLRQGRLYARGAQDNKGQLFCVLQGLACLRDAGQPLTSLRVLVDGEEECGSVRLASQLDAWRDALQADVLLVCDTYGGPDGRAAITAGLRGLVGLTVTLSGARHDLHSGIHGGIAPNPAIGLAHMLASLHDKAGRIRVPGFLDGIEPPSAEVLRLLQSSEWDDEAYARTLGVAPLGGERGRPALERRGFRPAIDVNGCLAGHTGAGQKTIIPSSATAKVSCRLCPGQQPERCLALLKRHCLAHCPPGLRLDFSDECVAGAGFRLSPDSPAIDLARQALLAANGREPELLWEGASIPIVERLRDVSGAAPLLVGFGSEADRIHAPNESFSIDQFRRGMCFAVQFMRAAAG